MTKAELVSKIAQKTGVEKLTTLAIVESMMNEIKESISANEAVFLRGFGTFKPKKRAEKTGRNIKKNTTIIIPAHHIPAFKPAKVFIQAVKNNIENKTFSFDKNFINYIHQADLCITRAGASTLAELSLMNIPFIAVPLPTAKDNHQLENANFYKDNNCCWIIHQNIFEEKIEDFLKNILENDNDYLQKKENLKKLNYQNTWINVNQKILRVINEN